MPWTYSWVEPEGCYISVTEHIIDSYDKIIIEQCYREILMSNDDNDDDNSYYTVDYNRELLQCKDTERYYNVELQRDM